MPMTQAPLTVQPKKLLDVSQTGTTRNKKFTNRTQFKIDIHKGGSKAACCNLIICRKVHIRRSDTCTITEPSS